jgi:hypothetical protein
MEDNELILDPMSRLMSDYEVTLVNDNSAPPLPTLKTLRITNLSTVSASI